MNRRGFLFGAGRATGGAVVAAATFSPWVWIKSLFAAPAPIIAPIEWPAPRACGLPKEAMNELAQWWADRQDQWFANQLLEGSEDSFTVGGDDPLDGRRANGGESRAYQ